MKYQCFKLNCLTRLNLFVEKSEIVIYVLEVYKQLNQEILSAPPVPGEVCFKSDVLKTVLRHGIVLDKAMR